MFCTLDLFEQSPLWHFALTFAGISSLHLKKKMPALSLKVWIFPHFLNQKFADFFPYRFSPKLSDSKKIASELFLAVKFWCTTISFVSPYSRMDTFILERNELLSFAFRATMFQALGCHRNG